MVCLQVVIYVLYIIIHSLVLVTLIGLDRINILGPLVFTGLLYVLCDYKYFTLANILVGFAILLGIFAEIFAFEYKDEIKHILQAQISHKDDQFTKDDNSVDSHNKNSQ